MKNNKKKNTALGWLLLIILIVLILGLNYVKFFANVENENVVEQEENKEVSKVVENALNEIVTNFNENEKVQNNNNKIKLSSTLNQFSIYISYEIEKEELIEGTYEFHYDDFELSITVPNDEKAKEEFKTIYEILAESVQKRLNNTNDISSEINDFINNSKEIDGLMINENQNDKTITYIMNITKKIGELPSDTTVVENQ